MIPAKKNLLIVCLCLMCTVVWVQPTERSLLLVASEELEIDVLSRAELRKVFLGVPVARNRVRLRPLLNSTDPLATSIFLQQVIFMSEREYRRQLVSRAFRLGDQRPREFDELDALVNQLRVTPGSLTYMWSDELQEQQGLKSLGVVWASTSN